MALALISFNCLEPLQYLNLFSLLVQVYDWSLCYDSLCTDPVANQSLSFCLAVMHTNSQQHILISPESKAHQSQLTGPPGPARAILKKCFILSVRHMWIWADDFASCVWEFLLPPRRVCSGCNDFSGGGRQLQSFWPKQGQIWSELKIKQKMFPEPLW